MDKERRRPAIILKLRQLKAKSDGNQAEFKQLGNEFEALLRGTNAVKTTISLKHFLDSVAKGIRKRDPEFTKQEADDFLLIVFVEGRCKGKGRVLTPQERLDYLELLEKETFFCHWTQLPVHFFTSFLFEMATPDRTVFYKTTNSKGRTVYVSYPYSHPEQINVLSGYWAQRYFLFNLVGSTMNLFVMH